MSPQDVKNVERVYEHLLARENRGWDGLDDSLDLLEYLEDDQLYRESEVALLAHSSGNVRCSVDHKNEECFIPLIVQAAAAIVALYKDTNDLDIKNKYILQYYLAMNEAEMIVVTGSGVSAI